jgi:AraC-like DNA-binding protein
LYKRAADGSNGLGPLWHIGRGLTLFVGPLDYNARHQHGAPVYLAGLYGSFGLRVRNGVWLTCRTAIIAAGVPHELDIGGNPLAVFYIEPDVAGLGTLLPLMRGARETDGILLGTAGETSMFRALYEDECATGWVGEALQDLAAHGERRAVRNIDPRMARAIAAVTAAENKSVSVAQVAAVAGLSTSRFQHVFSQETGVPFRRYRAWGRMRVALREIVDGNNFTNSAHAAGFCDQAHFNHDFRRTFGAPPSRSLVGIRA